MNTILDAFGRMSPLEASWWILIENVGLFLLALILGHALMVLFGSRPTGPPPDPLEWQEVALAALCVVGNAAVTIVGWWMWRRGIIVVRRDIGWRAWLDVVVLLFVMDLAMYVSHRVAHHRWVYPLVHRTHHRYDRPRPIDLFVLNPIEVLGFGGLWLAVITLYSSSWLGMLVYLALNLLFGMAGHLGVEPLPASWARWPVVGQVGTSTFHAGHHRDDRGNFGFYTLIWDRLFGTLHPDYVEAFGRGPGGGGAGPDVVRDRAKDENRTAD